MKAITIRQPWAWLIVHHPQIAKAGQPIKRVENRSWRTSHRGPLAIHAAKSRRGMREAYAFCESIGVILPEPDELVYGAVIGTVNVTDCVGANQLTNDPFAFGPWCHVYAHPQPLDEPVQCAGALSLWQWDSEASELIGAKE